MTGAGCEELLRVRCASGRSSSESESSSAIAVGELTAPRAEVDAPAVGRALMFYPLVILVVHRRWGTGTDAGSDGSRARRK